jgi:hypothetical protein
LYWIFPSIFIRYPNPSKKIILALRKPGIRLGIHVFKDAEVVDFAAPYGVFSMARGFDLNWMPLKFTATILNRHRFESGMAAIFIVLHH